MNVTIDALCKLPEKKLRKVIKKLTGNDCDEIVEAILINCEKRGGCEEDCNLEEFMTQQEAVIYKIILSYYKY